MPLGLHGASFTFVEIMCRMLKGIDFKICIFYLDDLVIFVSTLAELKSRIRCVFERIRAANLKINIEKTIFICCEVTLLGHVISGKGI